MIKALTGKPFFQSASIDGWCQARYIEEGEIETRRFVCYFWFIDWSHISLGLHVHLRSPNMEIHLPGGFLRIGWVKDYWGD